MNVSEQNNLIYTGQVEVFLEQEGKSKLLAKKHNEGTDALLNFIADCLAGRWSNLQYTVPGRVVLLENGEPFGGFTSGILYSNLPVVEKNAVKFHFRIPSLYFTKSHFITGARLLNIGGNTILANFNLDTPVEIPGGQTNITIIVNWILTIENAGSKTTPTANQNNNSSDETGQTSDSANEDNSGN